MAFRVMMSRKTSPTRRETRFGEMSAVRVLRVGSRVSCFAAGRTRGAASIIGCILSSRSLEGFEMSLSATQ